MRKFASPRATIGHAAPLAAATHLRDSGSQSRIWRGCAHSHGAQVELDQGTIFIGGGQFSFAFALAGAVVGFITEDGARYEADTWLTVVNLDTGARWSTARINIVNVTDRGADPAAGLDASSRVPQWMAWRSSASSCASPPGYGAGYARRDERRGPRLERRHDRLRREGHDSARGGRPQSQARGRSRAGLAPLKAHQGPPPTNVVRAD